MDITDLVLKASTLWLNGRRAEGLDKIYNDFDTLMMKGRFKDIGDVLKPVELSKTPSVIIIGILKNLREMYDKIPGSLAFVRAAVKELESRPTLDQTLVEPFKKHVEAQSGHGTIS